VQQGIDSGSYRSSIGRITMTVSQGKSENAVVVAEELVLGRPGVSIGETAHTLVFTRSKLHIWGMRSALSLTDQGLTSAAGFGVNLLLARWMPAEVYGAFAVAFAGCLVISGFHNVLLLEPLTVMGPSRHADRLSAYFRAQIGVHIFLTGILAAVALVVGMLLWLISSGSPLSRAVLGSGLMLPFLLLLWLARRMCYVVQRPSIAVVGSALYLAFVVSGLLLLGHFGNLGSFTAFLLMGCGSAFAAGTLLLRLGLQEARFSGEPSVRWRKVLAENWIYGRWLVGSTLLFSISSQTQTFLVAALLGLGATGILRAMQVPSLLMTQVTTAAGLLILPAFSYDFGRGLRERLRHKAMLVSLGLLAAGLCFAAFLALFAGPTERLLYEGKYAVSARLMAVFALSPVCTGFSMGYSMALRASQKPYFDLIANAVAASVAVTSAVCFIRWWGLAGAAASMIFGLGAYSLVAMYLFQVWLGRRTSLPSRCGA
jgi:O-antigen/teichoic acid export membrane protein